MDSVQQPQMIVGYWAMGDSLAGELVNRALSKATLRRNPPPGLLHHSDRGCQYDAGVYRALLCKHGIIPSMSRAGCCYDNAAMESFFATLKRELIHRGRPTPPPSKLSQAIRN